jgi:branched-subunit amino acid aminotransferase/4-amino-4-deoxychorismate lyase
MKQCIELNGAVADVDALRQAILTNYGHFTSMQVRDGSVRGLDLHLDRLARATFELFGSALDPDRVRTWMRQAIGGNDMPLSLRVQVFARTLDREHLDRSVVPDVLVATAPARTLETTPLRVRSVRYQREAPHIKHVGTFGLFQQKRLAQLQGFDDAVFVGPDGAIAEGTIWNIGFFDGERFTWPDASALDGVSMQLLKAGLPAIGIPSDTRRVGLAGLSGFRAAFFTNSSCVACPLACIDEIGFEADRALVDMLARAMDVHPWQRV